MIFFLIFQNIDIYNITQAFLLKSLQPKVFQRHLIDYLRETYLVLFRYFMACHLYGVTPIAFKSSNPAHVGSVLPNASFITLKYPLSIIPFLAIYLINKRFAIFEILINALR